MGCTVIVRYAGGMAGILLGMAGMFPGIVGMLPGMAGMGLGATSKGVEEIRFLRSAGRGGGAM